MSIIKRKPKSEWLADQREAERSIVLEHKARSQGKLPPADQEMEKVVLGALLLEQTALFQVIDILHQETFYDQKHRKIYAAIRRLFSRSESIDLMTVTQELRVSGELEFVGGAYYVTELTSKVDSAANIVYHGRILVQMAIKRELITIGGEMVRDSFEDTSDVFEIIDQTEAEIFKISEKNFRKNFEQAGPVLTKALNNIEAAMVNKGKLTGVPSGFTRLDAITAGWQKSDLTIMAARPGMGKTAAVVTAARNAALEFGKPVAIFSLEMSSVQLMNRLISAEAEVDGEKLRRGDLSQYEWDQIITRTARLHDAPIFIDDTPGLTVLELRAKARRLVSTHKVEMIIIDYLQLMSGDAKGSGNREQEISKISRSLKQVAKELEVPVIALSQLSRAVETRGGDKRPQLSDLRESGSLEQDADNVIFLYRPEYYGITEDEEGNNTQGLAEFIIAKNRHGKLDTVHLRFIGKYTQFRDWDDDTTREAFQDMLSAADMSGSLMDSNLPASAHQQPADPKNPLPF